MLEPGNKSYVTEIPTFNEYFNEKKIASQFERNNGIKIRKNAFPLLSFRKINFDIFQKEKKYSISCVID